MTTLEEGKSGEVKEFEDTPKIGSSGPLGLCSINHSNLIVC